MIRRGVDADQTPMPAPTTSAAEILAALGRLDLKPFMSSVIEHVAHNQATGAMNLMQSLDEYLNRYSGLLVRLESGQTDYNAEKHPDFWRDLKTKLVESDAPSSKSLHAFLGVAAPHFIANTERMIGIDRVFGTNILFNLFALSRMYEMKNPLGKRLTDAATETRLNALYLSFVASTLQGSPTSALPASQNATRTTQLIEAIDAFRDDTANSAFIHFKPDTDTLPYDVNMALRTLRRTLAGLAQKEGAQPQAETRSAPLTPLQLVCDFTGYLATHGDKLPPQESDMLRGTCGMLLDHMMIMHICRESLAFGGKIRPHFQCLAPNGPWMAAGYFKLDAPHTVDDVSDDFNTRIANEIDSIAAGALAPKQKAEKIAKARARAAAFQTLIESVPAGMELVSFHYTKRPSAEKQTLRKDIDAKKTFMRAVARKHWFALWQMNVKPRHIFHIAAHGTVPSDPKGALYDMNIEHIYDLSGGGFNAHLCLMPAAINQRNGQLVELQTRDLEAGETRLVVAYAPKRNHQQPAALLTKAGKFTRRYP